MTNPSQNNKRIAKNTLLLYVRMFIMMIASLFTSRIVLDVLGATDYGIYNIIGGVVVLFSFFNNALLSATQRYLNFFLGKQDFLKTRKIFCISLNIYMLLSLIFVILAETIGIWFIKTQLNIPLERMNAAHIVYQFSVITFIIGLIRIPYNASIIAYEKMNFYAYISLLEVTLKLLVVYLLYISPFDKLVIYSLLYTIVPLLITLVYKLYCNKKIVFTKYTWIWDKKIFFDLFSFSGWSLFGSIANVSASQGLNILINIFYGVTVNAAAGIANQVSAQVFQFISNFQMAFNPQIVKSYASGQNDNFYKLVFRASKFSYFMILIIALPMMLTADSLLAVWLKVIPEYTAIFCRLILGFMIIEAISAPLWMSVQATGKIRSYQILMACCILLNLPLAYIVLKSGMPVYSVWIIKIAVNAITLTVRCIYMKKTMNFPLRQFSKEVLGLIIIVTLLVIPLPLTVNFYSANSHFYLPLTISTTVITSLIAIYYLGLDKNEKELVICLIKKKILQRKK